MTIHDIVYIGRHCGVAISRSTTLFLLREYQLEGHLDEGQDEARYIQHPFRTRA